MHWRRSWDEYVTDNTQHLRAQIGLVKTHGFSSWLIRVITRSNVNHVVIRINAGEEVSAEYPKVRTREPGHFTNVIWSQFDYTTEQRDKIASFALQQVGKPYGWADDLAIGIGLITKERTPRWIMRWLNNNGEWICSSLADAALRHAGIHIWNDGRPIGSVYPGSFQRFYNDAGWLPKKILFSKRT